MNRRECGKCTACCDGHLAGEAYGHQFYPGTPCHFLIEKKCSIYENRPSVCQKYFCAWTQGLFPEWMSPIKVGFIISVEYNTQGQQYFKVIPMKGEITKSFIETLDSWTKQYDSYYLIIPLVVK